LILQQHRRNSTYISGIVQTLLLASLLSAQTAGMQSARTQAALDFQHGRFAEAEEILHGILKNNPTDLNALVLLGPVLDSEGRYADADGCYEQALKLAPASVQVLNNAANHFVKAGNGERARALYERLLAVAPSHVNANLQMAVMSLDSGHGEEALAFLNRIAKAERAEPQVLLLRARALEEAKRYSEAANLLRQLKTAAVSDPGWSFSLGMAFARCQMYREAESEFSKAATTDPHDFDVQYNLGLAAFKNKDFQTAKVALSAAIAEQPGSADTIHLLNQSRLAVAEKLFRNAGPKAALKELDGVPERDRDADYGLLRAQILDAMGEVQEAAKSINQAIRSSPTRPDLYFEAEGFLLKHKLYHEALDLLDQAHQVTTNSKELLLAKSVVLELLNRESDAGKLLQEMEIRWPDWDRPYLLQGMLFEIELRSGEAKNALQLAIKLGAETPEAYYYLARADTHLNPPDLNAARIAIQHGMRLSSSDAYLYLLAGRISLAQKQYVEATELFERALRLRPNLIPAHYGLLDADRALKNGREASEIQQIKSIAKERETQDTDPLWMENFLFKVPPPGL
jgi:tetratricopeptide (TPR) repeat protein